MGNPVLDALLQALSQKGGIQPTVNASFSNPGQGNPYGVTYSPTQPPMSMMSRIFQGPKPAEASPAIPPEISQSLGLTQSPATPSTIPPTTPAAPTKPSPQLNEYGRTKFGELLYRMGIPLGAAVVGTAFPGALNAASGLASGYAGQTTKNDELALEKEKIRTTKAEKSQAINKDRWDEAYKLAASISKDPFSDQLSHPLTPNQLSELANRIYQVRSTDEITQSVKDKALGKSDEKGYKSGDTRSINGVNFTRDKNGNWTQTN